MKKYPDLSKMQPNIDVFYASWKLVYDNIFDKTLRNGKWERIGNSYLGKAKKAKSHKELHDIIQEMLDSLNVSHLRIMDSEVYDHDIKSEMENILVPHYGLDIEKIKNGYYIREVVEGSIASKSNARRGDQVLFINNIRIEDSPLLRPSGTGGVHRIHPRGPVRISVSRKNKLKHIDLFPSLWNRIEATKNSQKVFVKDNIKMCYIHIWHLANYDIMNIFKKFAKEQGHCHGMILDLRGFGGAIIFLDEFLNIVKSFGNPVVAIIDKETRSIKETISVHLKKKNMATLVGEKTIGSCLASQFFDLPDGSKMIIPVRNMRRLTAGVAIEGNGVKPHINIPISVPNLNGQDPHLVKSVDVLHKKILKRPFMNLGDYIYRIFDFM